jgi:hypothetical protein
MTVASADEVGVAAWARGWRVCDRRPARIGADAVMVGFFLLLAVLHGALLYTASGHDDSHITYWAARTLAAAGEILNYNGERIEQSSTLLLVLLLGAVHGITGIALPTLGPISSAVFSVLAILGACRLARAAGVARVWPVAMLLAVSPFLVHAGTTGMETSLNALIAVLLVRAVALLLSESVSTRRVAAVVAAELAFVLVRPESILVAVAFLTALTVWHLAGHRTPRQRAEADWRKGLACLWLGLLAVTILMFAARFLYFGALFAQPVGAKTGGLSAATLHAGLQYLVHASGLLDLALPLLLVAGAVRLIHLGSSGRVEAAYVAILGFVAAQLAFVLFVGGDWMIGARFIVPVIPVMAAGAIIAAECLLPLRRLAKATLLGAATLLAAADTSLFLRLGSMGVPLAAMHDVAPAAVMAQDGLPRVAWLERANLAHLRDALFIPRLEAIVDDLQRDRPGPQVTIASAQMGMVVYHLALDRPGAFRVIDIRGLVTDDLTRCPAARALVRNVEGTMTSYDDLFAPAGGLLARCGIDRPDIVFDLPQPMPGVDAGQRLDSLARDGYTVVYAQDGLLDTGWGPALRADEFVAVRNDRLGSIAPEHFTTLRW